MEDKVIIHAPAKINLLLRVTGKRSDGYHNLVTLFHPVYKIRDELKIDLNAPEGIALSCEHPEVPADSTNLVCKAAAAFAEKMSLTPAWHIELVKHIPVAAGMGGGSSDAGRTLRFLAEHFSNCSENDLKIIAGTIGADVPFFLAPQDASARGIGEIITGEGDLPMPPMLVLFPAFPVSAAWAYKQLKQYTSPEQAEEELQLLTDALRMKNFEQAANLCANDLEKALFDKFPLLGTLRRELLAKGALCVHVSGSGPALFAMFGSRESCAEAAAALGTKAFLEAGIKIMEC